MTTVRRRGFVVLRNQRRNDVRECEVKEAVELAHEWQRGDVVMFSDDMDKVTKALIAVYNDDVSEDDDDDEPTFPVTGAFGEHPARALPENPTFVDEEKPPRAGLDSGIALREMGYVDEPPHRDAWPPWNPMPLPVSPRSTWCVLHVGHDAAQNYHIGMKLLADNQKRGLLRGFWRWLTKSNWRVVSTRDGLVTCERSR